MSKVTKPGKKKEDLKKMERPVLLDQETGYCKDVSSSRWTHKFSAVPFKIQQTNPMWTH